MAQKCSPNAFFGRCHKGSECTKNHNLPSDVEVEKIIELTKKFQANHLDILKGQWFLKSFTYKLKIYYALNHNTLRSVASRGANKFKKCKLLKVVTDMFKPSWTVPEHTLVFNSEAKTHE